MNRPWPQQRQPRPFQSSIQPLTGGGGDFGASALTRGIDRLGGGMADMMAGGHGGGVQSVPQWSRQVAESAPHATQQSVGPMGPPTAPNPATRSRFQANPAQALGGGVGPGGMPGSPGAPMTMPQSFMPAGPPMPGGGMQEMHRRYQQAMQTNDIGTMNYLRSLGYQGPF